MISISKIGYKKERMKPIKIYCVKRNKFRKFLNHKVSYIFDKTSVLSTTFSNAVIIMIEYSEKKKALRN